MTTLSVALRSPRATSAPVRFWHAAFVITALVGCLAVLSCTTDGLPIGPTNTGGQTDGGTTNGNGDGNGNGNGTGNGSDSTGVDSTGVDSSKVDSSSVDPGDPGSADVHVTVDATQTTPISPWIYGVNSMEMDALGSQYFPWFGAKLPPAFTLNRAGGNRWSAYNWENNDSNSGNDAGFSNDSYLSSSHTPGEAVRTRVAASFARGAGILVTVPMLDYVAADASGATGSDEAGRDARLAAHFHRNVPRKAGAFTLSPNASDDTVYEDEFVNWLTHTFPGHTGSSDQPLFFSLDNEPDIWYSTHAEVESPVNGQPRLQTYAGFTQRTIDYASAIKDVAPDAVVFGPAVATYAGMAALGRIPNGSWVPDPVYGTQFFLDVYLDLIHHAEQQQGRKLLDVLDVHWYLQGSAGGRGLADDRAPQSDALIDARLQAPRSLWDPTYDEGSWVSAAVPGPIQLIPKLRSRIDAHDPGTKIAITEYYYGGGGYISGGLAQADVLGIFGREGVFAATLWPNADVTGAYGSDGAKAYAYIFGAFDLFRNYDGSGSTIGDREALVTTSDTTRSSVYAAVDAKGRTVLVAINKTRGPLSMGIAVTGPAATTASVYTMVDGSPTPAKAPDVPSAAQNAFVITLPAMSASTIVLH
jgi:hypothetical protein